MLQEEIEHSKRVIATLIHQIQADGSSNSSTTTSNAPPNSSAPKRDYARQNFARIQQLRTSVLGKLTEKPKESSNKRFAHVQPKVYDSTFQNQKKQQPSAQSQSASFQSKLHNKENIRTTLDFPKSAAGKLLSSSRNKPATPIPKLELGTPSTVDGSKEAEALAPRRRNADAKTTDRKRQHSALHKLGTIPKYLQERKAAAKQPKEGVEVEETVPGKRLLPDDERMAMLDKLKAHEAELLTSLSMLPLRLDTVHLQQRKHNIELQLFKVEDGIKVFSRPKVFVKND